MLRELPAGEASITISAAQEEKIRAELAGDYARIGSRIGDRMQFAR
jgi:hypothetical protein